MGKGLQPKAIALGLELPLTGRVRDFSVDGRFPPRSGCVKNEGALRMRFFRHGGIYRSDVSSLLFTPGACPAFRSGRCQGIGQAGKNLPCPSSAMSSGRLFLDRVARLHCPSPLHRHVQHKTIARSKGMIYYRTANSLLTVCLTRGDKRRSRPALNMM